MTRTATEDGLTSVTPLERSCFALLDSIRARGVTSMSLASPRLRRERHLSAGEAASVLRRWAEHYDSSHASAALFGREAWRADTRSPGAAGLTDAP